MGAAAAQAALANWRRFRRNLKRRRFHRAQQQMPAREPSRLLPQEEVTASGAATVGAVGISFSVSPATFEYLCRSSAKRSALTVSFRSR